MRTICLAILTAGLGLSLGTSAFASEPINWVDTGTYGSLEAPGRFVARGQIGGSVDASRVHGQGLISSQRVVAAHDDIGANLTHEMTQIVDKTVIVIYQQKHGSALSSRHKSD